jgi:hypothetical protein
MVDAGVGGNETGDGPQGGAPQYQPLYDTTPLGLADMTPHLDWITFHVS